MKLVKTMPDVYQAVAKAHATLKTVTDVVPQLSYSYSRLYNLYISFLSLLMPS